jgi:hypothetical protein
MRWLERTLALWDMDNTSHTDLGMVVGDAPPQSSRADERFFLQESVWKSTSSPTSEVVA